MWLLLTGRAVELLLRCMLLPVPNALPKAEHLFNSLRVFRVWPRVEAQCGFDSRRNGDEASDGFDGSKGGSRGLDSCGRCHLDVK